MLTNVQVLPGATSVARYADVVVWFETGPPGGGAVLTQLLASVQDVSSGRVASRQLGAHLAAVLNAGGHEAVPALVAATPEGRGLRVVVHGWGSMVADGIHVPNGWLDQVIDERRTFFLGRNTVSPLAPVEGSALDLEGGIVPGDGVSFVLSASGAEPRQAMASTPAPPRSGASAAASAWAPSAAPVAEAPPAPVSVPLPVEPPAYEPPPSDPPLPSGQRPAPAGAPVSRRPSDADPSGPGRLMLDDGRSAVLERTCVLGSAPHGSPAVQTGVALPLSVTGTGVAALHVEIRVEPGKVAVRDLGSAPTYVLAPGAASWSPLAPGEISVLAPGSRIAIGQRTLSYVRP